MKKKQLKRKLEVATEALIRYRGYMIDGVLYADKALNDMDIIDNEKFYYDVKLRKEIRKNIIDILEREFKL
jgi:hypothetical protein